jgi:hypothetical protein
MCALAWTAGCGSGGGGEADAAPDAATGDLAGETAADAPATDAPPVTNVAGTRLYYYTTYPDILLRSVRVDGTDLQTHMTLATPPQTIHDFEQSPGRRHVVFWKAKSAGVLDGTRVLDLDAFTDTLIGEVNPMQREWSPDSTRILFTDAKGYAIRDVSGAPVASGGDPGETDLPVFGPAAWSPDGTRIVFHYSRLGGAFNKLVFTDADLKNPASGKSGDLYGFLALHWVKADRILAITTTGLTILDDQGAVVATHAYPADWEVENNGDIGRQHLLPRPMPDGDHLLVRLNRNNRTEIHLTSLDFTTEDKTIADNLQMIRDDEWLVAPSHDAVFLREKTSRVVAFDGQAWTTFPEDMRSCHAVAWR